MEKSFVLLCTSNKQSETEINKTKSFTIASKHIKYLGRNLTKKCKRTVHWTLQNTAERN